MCDDDSEARSAGGDTRAPRRRLQMSPPVRAMAMLLGLAGAGIFWAPTPAEAHGRLGAAEGQCRLFVGPDYMKFTGYNPDSSKNEFCEDIPSTGRMIIALDDEQAELRDMRVEIRIVKDVGGEAKENENLEAVTVAYREPKLYLNGTINFEHNFPEPGYFVGIVTAIGDHGERWVSRFPFSVGMSFVRTLPVYFLLTLGVCGALAIYMRHRRVMPKPVATIGAPPPHDPDPEPNPAE
jgi:hypothetical protein